MQSRLVIFFSFLLLTSCELPSTNTESPSTADRTVLPQNNPLYHVVLTKPVDSLCAVKHLRELSVYRKGKRVKIYRFALGDAPVGHKHFEGDERTPEGLYFINDRNAASSCHKNLGISYPNAADKAFAKKKGKSPGGDIKIHGLPNGQGHVGRGHLARDWTNGCIAVTDEEIDELYVYVKKGAPIMLLP